MTTQKRNKITDIYETKILTRTERNESGKWETVQKEIRYKRPIDDLSSGLRSVNFLIDLFIFQALAIVLAEFELLNSIPFSQLLFISLFPAYYILSEFYFQRTIGKFFTQSIVVNEYGDKPDFQTIVVRTVIRLIPFEAFSFLGDNRGWHDKWTDTYVIKKSEKERLEELMADPDNLKP